MSAFSAAAQDEDGDIISALQDRVADLEAQLYAVGAGGVGKLTTQGVEDSALLSNIESPFNACMHQEHCKQWKQQAHHPEQHLDMVPVGSTESAYQRGYLDGMAKGRRDAAMDADARVFYDHDTSEVDRYLGFKPTVPLYTRPQPKREPLTVGQINRLIADGKLPLSGNPYEVARAIERAHGIGGEA